MHVNEVTIMGFVGADPRINTSSKGVIVANINVATTKRWLDKDSNKQESVEWHRVVAFGKVAKIVQDHVKKGVHLYIKGFLRTRKWLDSKHDNAPRFTTEIILSKVFVLGNKDKTVKNPPYINPDDIKTAGEGPGVIGNDTPTD